MPTTQPTAANSNGQRRGGLRSALMPYTERRVLVLEEAPLRLEQICQVLRLYGMRAVMPATSVLAAVEVMREAPVDAVILELVQQAGDMAFTVAEYLGRVTGTAPEFIIAIPKDASLALRQMATNRGFGMFVPGDEAAMVGLVAGALERKWRQRQAS